MSVAYLCQAFIKRIYSHEILKNKTKIIVKTFSSSNWLLFNYYQFYKYEHEYQLGIFKAFCIDRKTSNKIHTILLCRKAAGYLWSDVYFDLKRMIE